MLPGQQTESESDAPNHPLGKWMVLIAFLNQNITLGCIFGSFSVFLGPVEARLGIGRELSSLAMPAASITYAICGPLIGVMASRFSIKLILIFGCVLNIAGYLLLALVPSYTVYLLAYGLFLGPAMAVAVILPGTLVTRWFTRNRGKALGLISTPILMATVPLLSVYMLGAHGLALGYGSLAALGAVSLVANFFVIERPPGSVIAGRAQAHGAAIPAGATILTMGELLKRLRFWVLTLGFGVSSAAATVYAAHTVPMVRSWGMSGASGATLVSITFFAGIAGTLIFGWLGDRLGGALTLGILLFDMCVFSAALILHPSFIATAVIFALIGTHTAGIIPVISLGLSEAFGRESFSRAYGLVTLCILPITLLSVPAAAMVFTHTGSYTGAIIGMGAALALSALASLTTTRQRPQMLIGA